MSHYLDGIDTPGHMASTFGGRHVLVTGAAGFLGSHLCGRLVSLGADVVGMDNMSTGRRENVARLDKDAGFRLVAQDVTTPFTAPCQVDFVFHLASPASPRDYLRLPLETMATGSLGTLHALELAHRNGARFLLASTSEVYGDPLHHPQHESHWGNVNPIGPRSVYDEAKRYAEALTAAYQREGRVSAVMVRIFNTYGPRMRPGDGRMVPTFIDQALSSAPLTVAGDGTQTRSLCYVDDTVDGMLRAAASRHTGPINLGNPHETTVLEVAERIRLLCRTDAPIAFVALPQDDPQRRCPDIAAARSLLGWEPDTGLDDGLARTVARARKARDGTHTRVAPHGRCPVTSSTSPRGHRLPPIVCGIDGHYAAPLCALMGSIAAAHPDVAGLLRLIVLHQQLDTVTQQLILGHARRLHMPVELRAVHAPDGRFPVSGWVSDAVYLRLSIAEAIPDEPVVLYLDADTVVLGDLRPLLESGLDGAPLAAVRDPQNPLIGSGIALPGWRSLELPASRDYFNSGVMLLDLTECRRRGLFHTARTFLLNYPNSVRFWDQDALNWAAGDEWKRLERRWNTFALSPLAGQPGFIHHAEPMMPLRTLLADEDTAAVLHFAGPDKPWHDDYPTGEIRDTYRRFLAAARDGRGR